MLFIAWCGLLLPRVYGHLTLQNHVARHTVGVQKVWYLKILMLKVGRKWMHLVYFWAGNNGVNYLENIHFGVNSTAFSFTIAVNGKKNYQSVTIYCSAQWPVLTPCGRKRTSPNGGKRYKLFHSPGVRMCCSLNLYLRNRVRWPKVTDNTQTYSTLAVRSHCRSNQFLLQAYAGWM